MTAFELLWRLPNGEYKLIPFGQRLSGAVYVGSLRQLAERYRNHGRDWFLARLPGLPAEVLAAVETRHTTRDRVLAKLAADVAAAQAEAALWGDTEPA
jgi:hypothetical protein